MSSTSPSAALAHTGLTADEVAARERAGDVNTLPDDSSRSLWSILRANVFTLFNGIVLSCFVLLFVVGEWKDALFGFSAVANAIIGVVQEYRAKKALDELALIHAPVATVIRDGERQEIAREAVVRGDTIVVTAGDQIPADAELLEVHGLAVDESLLTGESEPVTKRLGEEVLAGSSVVAGHGIARVRKVGSEAYAAKLTQEAKRFSLVQSEIRNGLNRVLRWIAWMLFPVLAIVVNAQMHTIGGWEVAIQTGAWRSASVGAIGAAIAMVPLGLILMTSVAFAVGAVKLSRQQVLVQELPAVEGLARVDVICFDKTGTLTDGSFTFDAASAPDGGAPVEPWASVVEAMALDEHANDTAKALASGLEGGAPARIARSIPFSSARKWSAVVVEDGEARGTWVLGAAELVLSRTAEHAQFLDLAATKAAEGRRALLLAYSEQVLDADACEAATKPADLRGVAVLTLRESIRDDAADTIAYFREQGVSMRVISGDDPRTVGAVAQAVGLHDGPGFDARELPEDPDELAEVLERERVFGRVTPEQKRAMVHALQSRDHVVAMTGDGVNDVLALKDADLGIAMGNGAAATRAVARLVLLDGRFSHLPGVVKEGRQVIANVERVSMLFLSKTAYSIFIALCFGLLVWGFPFLPRQLSALDGLTIGLPGFILALIPNPQRYRRGFLKRALEFAIPSGAIVLLAILSTSIAARVLGIGLDEARTACCITLGIAALWILNVLARPLSPWRAALLATCYAGMLLVMTAPFVSDFFAFRLPGMPMFGIAVGVGVAAMVLIEIPSRVTRARHNATRPARG